jgi:NDP-sugar pyrophosphorylase family protein
MKYKVLITTSGVGTRLGEITSYTNKSLVRVGEKPSISHIIESYPRNTEFVITLGYFGNHVRDFLELAYPETNFEFVNVENFNREGSSLLFSLYQAKDLLQIPFIFHASDTITKDEISEPKNNWIAGYKGKESSSYASINIYGSKVKSINHKGHMNYDLIHVGLIGIFNYEEFWSIAEKILKNDPLNSTLGDVDVLKEQISVNSFESKEISTWYDIGSVNSLKRARKKISNDKFHVLDKLAESIYLIDGYFIKFFSDLNIVKHRVKRTEYLNSTTPEIISSKGNFYKYKYVEGNLFSEISNRNNFLNFIKWSEKNLWKKVEDYDSDKFKKDCRSFYYDKTLSRIKDFHEKKNISDIPNIINGESIPSLKDLLSKVNFDELILDSPTNFHGDFILDNIIQVSENDFKLIDWRQDFAGNLEGGDKYYDLAKLAHNLVVNHDIIDKDLFEIFIKNSNEITVNINRTQTLVDSENLYFEYLKLNDYNVKKIKLLRAIIWLNMSPLHHHPFDLFLYYFGKYELAKIINTYK